MPIPKNLLIEVPEKIESEMFQELLRVEGVRIERILSDGHVTAEGQWYDQEWDEWVLLLAGKARIEYPSDASGEAGEPVTLIAGSHLFLPRRCRHRVSFTAPKTIWLAVHFPSSGEAGIGPDTRISGSSSAGPGTPRV